MKKSPHVIWVSPTSHPFFRSKGEVKCRPGSVIPRLTEHGIKVDVLIPHDPTLLPKTKLSPGRTTHHKLHLGQDYSIAITKLTRGSVMPGIYMVSFPPAEPAISSALFSKAALALAEQLKKPVDIFHLFDWEVALVPLFLEMEKSHNRLFKNTRTFLNITTLREHGNFSPNILNHIGVPENLFHPEGIEFYGKISYLKAGLIFADGVGLVESALTSRNMMHRNGHGFEGVFDSQSHKLRRWASDRSLRSHVDAYLELISMPVAGPVLPRVMQKVHTNNDQVDKFIESWGPPPPDRTHRNGISFLIQSPTKAYAFWEWTRFDYSDYGITLEDLSSKSKRVLSRGQNAFGDFWIEVQPGHEYVVELIGFKSNGDSVPLLRSRPVKIPRIGPSLRAQAVFIDVKSRQRFIRQGDQLIGAEGLRKFGSGTSAWEWSGGTELPSSYREVVPSK